MELLPNFGYDLLRRFVDVDGDGFMRFLQVGDLGDKNLPIGKMPLPRTQTMRDEIWASFQIHESHVRPRGELSPIAFLKRGASQHYTDFGGTPVRNADTKEFQPGAPVVVVERDPLPNLFNIGPRMKIVGVRELPLQLLC